MKSNKLIARASLALVLAGPVIVFAGPADKAGEDKITVSYADLNIKHEAGAKVLYRRLQRAAESACDVDSLQAPGPVTRLAETRQCYKDVLDESVAKIDSEALNKIHSS